MVFRIHSCEKARIFGLEDVIRTRGGNIVTSNPLCSARQDEVRRSR